MERLTYVNIAGKELSDVLFFTGNETAGKKSWNG